MTSNSSLKIIALITSLIVITNCSSNSISEVPVDRSYETIKSSKVSYQNIEVIEALIKEGVTSRSDVLSILGKPQGLGKSSYGDIQLMYKFKDMSKVVNLNYMDKNGNLYEFIYPTEDSDQFWILIGDNNLVNGIETL